MQRVVRSTLAGLVALAALTACGDKNTIVQPSQAPPGVNLVTVTPSAPNLNVGDQITLVASVSADAGVTDRTVAWSTSNAAIATVDAASGVVKAVSAGVATITATSNADKTQKGAAVVTVGGGSPVTVTIASIVSNATGNNVDLSNVSGQIDVTLNVDAGTNKLAGVDLIMNCNAPSFPATSDVVVATQTISSTNVAVAEAAAAPVTLSFNTAQLDSLGLNPVFKNGQCQIKGRARLAGSATQAASNSQAITLNNVDAIILKPITTTPNVGQVATATDAGGALWRAGSVTVSAAAISYSGKTYSIGAISLLNGGNDNALGRAGLVVGPGASVATTTGISPASGLFTATFSGTDSTTAAGVASSTVDSLTFRITTLDNTGNAGPTLQTFALLAAGQNFIRLDNRAPDVTTTPVTFVANTQNTSAGWVGKAFVFSIGTSAGNPINPGSSANDNASLLPVTSSGGVGKVSDTTQFAPSGTTTWTTFTSVTALAETPAASGPQAYDLRLRVCDALGNCRNTPGVLTTFGVDLTAPAAALGAPSVVNNTVVGIGQALTTSQITIAGTDPQGANGATGSGFGPTPVLASETRLAPSGATGQATTCVLGTPNSAGTACATPAPEAFQFTLPVAGTANPGQYVVTYTVTDQAGNQTTASTIQFYLDSNAPTVSGGFTIPASVTTGTTFTASATDNMDLLTSNGILHYPIALGTPSIRIVEPSTLSAGGVAFDNTLTRSATATTTLAQFYRSLGTINGTTFSAIVAPDSVGIRAVDAAGNLSTPDEAAIPAANVSAGTAFSATNLAGAFTLAASPTTLSNGTGTGATSTTLTATVNAVSLTSNTPFTQMCFYVVTPAGGAENGLGHPATRTATNDYVLIGCTNVVVTTDNAGTRTFTYTMAFNPDAAYGTAGTLNVVAIGASANTDGLAAQPAAITLQP